MCQSDVMDGRTYVLIPTMSFGRFSRNLTTRLGPRLFSLYLTMCGFKILSLAVTKVLLAGSVCQSSSHARPLFHSQKPKLGKCLSKQDDKGILLECTVSYLFMRIKSRMNHIHCIFPIPQYAQIFTA